VKKLTAILGILLLCTQSALAEEIHPIVEESKTSPANQSIEMIENKIIVNVQKQPMNENSNQNIVLKKNWFVVNIQVNGKVKVKPLQMEYEVE